MKLLFKKVKLKQMNKKTLKKNSSKIMKKSNLNKIKKSHKIKKWLKIIKTLIYHLKKNMILPKV